LNPDFPPDSVDGIPETLRYSHYATRLLARHPEWLRTLRDDLARPFDRAQM